MSFLKCTGVMSPAVKLLSPVVKRRTAVVHRLIGSKKRIEVRMRGLITRIVTYAALALAFMLPSVPLSG
jgi:hypothetical protein